MWTLLPPGRPQLLGRTARTATSPPIGAKIHSVSAAPRQHAQGAAKQARGN
jgi:hypothetical protein